MTNPFIFSPRTITNVNSARYVLGLYQNDINQANLVRTGINEALAATLDVLIQAHPDLAADLHLLVDQAMNGGHADGVYQDTTVIQAQFKSALPYEIRKQLEAP